MPLDSLVDRLRCNALEQKRVNLHAYGVDRYGVETTDFDDLRRLTAALAANRVVTELNMGYLSVRLAIVAAEILTQKKMRQAL